MTTHRLTMAQALIRYLARQQVERDGVTRPFFGGCLGIFGHGNVAGIGQALQEQADLRYYPYRNEQAMVHSAVAYARMKNRLGAMVCTSSIGPGATNMVTGAALATINRLPVLLLPGDIFSRRNVAPVLQQLESEASQDISVNDCFRPVCRYWDRINRPDQLLEALPQAMRVLTSPAQTGAVVLALPQDVQTEAFDYPDALFERSLWHVARPRVDAEALRRAAEALRTSERPLIVAGGGVIYSEACGELAQLAAQSGIPVAETQAGKGSLHCDHPQNVGGIGITGTLAANLLAKDADLVLGIGTRYSDFTTASKTAFQNPELRFVNINISEFDACKQHALRLVGDAKSALQELQRAIVEFRVCASYAEQIGQLRQRWDAEVEHIYELGNAPLPSQGEIIGVLNRFTGDSDVVINAAGSGPGDLHKLWRSRDPKQYHVEYGYSCMGYEVPAGLGAKLAAPERDIYVIIGDGSYLMMSSELATAVQEHLKITVIVIDNHGFASIGGLSQAIGSQGFGTEFRLRQPDGHIGGPSHLPIDLAANAASLGVLVSRCTTLADFQRALEQVREVDHPCVIVVETDRGQQVGSYQSWWDVPIAEVSTQPSVQQARQQYEQRRSAERYYGPGQSR